jgi:predicted nucleotide-binding protein
MRAVERYRTIEAVAHFFADLPISEVNAILATVRAAQWNARWWQGADKDERIGYVRTTAFVKSSDEVLESLREFMLDSRPEGNDAFKALDEILAEYEVEQAASIKSPSAAAGAPQVLDGPIFVVHGHAHAVLHEAVRVLERGTGREVTVLHEQPNAGRTILEKFEDHAVAAAFAVVLLTADDEGGVRTSDDMQLRGRQNVIFELGFFFGSLGRKRVAVLLEQGVEKPSDIEGLVYITLDAAGAWKYVLARELEAADISVDRSRIP